MTTSVASTVEIEPLAKLEPYAPLFFGLMFALPTLLAGYPPMTDLPLHESIIGVLRHWGDPKYFPPDLYILNLGHPNQLFYFLALPFSYVVGTTHVLSNPAHHWPRVPSCLHAFAVMNLGEIVKTTIESTGL